MYTEATLMFMYCETPLHVGSGTSLGIVDLPIQRERYTSFPLIAGTGLKGALRDWFENSPATKDKVVAVFGPDKDGSEHSGAFSLTDARLLLFPVRSMKGVFAWITCPTVLARLERDLQLVKKKFTITQNGKETTLHIPKVGDKTVLVTGGSKVKVDSKVVLEEYAFDVGQDSTEQNSATNIASWIVNNGFPPKPADSTNDEYDYWRQRFLATFVIVSDNDFTDFVQHSTEINARIKIDNNTKTVVEGALFYQEDLPSDSLLYSAVLASTPHIKTPMEDLTSSQQVLEYLRKLESYRIQVGGDSTLGRGFVKVHFLK
jgi:CRISPR-associated protein Cmr4